ncbi:hypothetical protein A2Y85_04060 [candidate division WOR-3 bacterium RBG_13_43_14]|uniref:Peptidase S49 domain-containing protein n=1 Tax=candidate division WOR-3 bacterium RBG_13_43_14 TaxID=1802590 RepID=A0A1F4U9Y2_UNCW3|nr:MAG: hypothetical protein A2Y85_04060 [candidate division WOR-3 bacterium RBG_13_43_14]
MKTIHYILIAVVVVAVIIGLTIGIGLKGNRGGGNIGVIEVIDFIGFSKTVVKDIKTFTDDPSIDAIIIRVDSPGGVVAAAQEIYEQLKISKEKKKIVVSMGTVAASGGYYISLPADLIVANPGTITGSIGVIMEYPVFYKLLDKLGVGVETIKSRDHKDIGSPFRSLTASERDLLQSVVLDVYDQFVNAVAEHRGLSRDSVLLVADGRILTGRQAKEFGLIDTLGSFEQTVDLAADMIGIKEPYLVYPPSRMSFIDMFVKPVEKLLTPKLMFVLR